MKYLNYFAGMYYKPYSTLKNFKREQNQLGYAFLFILTQVGVAGGKQLFYHVTKHPAIPEPWLRIPNEMNWLFSFYLLIPTIIVQCIIFSGIITLVSKLFHGKGSFEGQFSMYTLGYIPVILLFIVIVLMFNLLHYSNILSSVIFWGLLVWDFATMFLSVKIEQDLKFLPTLLCSILGFGCSFLFSFTYVR